MQQNKPAELLDGWQPIETAPKDGTRILLACLGDESSFSGFWDDGAENYWKRAGWYDAEDAVNILTAKPMAGITHWMPLPKPPADEPASRDAAPDKRMSRKELEVLRALCTKATPGPWSYDTYNIVWSGSEREKNLVEICSIPDEPETGESPERTRDNWYPESSANAQLIAVARTALPQLIDEHEELLRRVREWVEADKKLCGYESAKRIEAAEEALREYVREDA